jgi:hypothetical protein
VKCCVDSLKCPRLLDGSADCHYSLVRADPSRLTRFATECGGDDDCYWCVDYALHAVEVVVVALNDSGDLPPESGFQWPIRISIT